MENPHYDLADRIKDGEISDQEINDAFGELNRRNSSYIPLKTVANMHGAMTLVELLVGFINKEHTIEIAFRKGKYFVDIGAIGANVFFAEGEHKYLYRAILIAGLNLMGILIEKEMI